MLQRRQSRIERHRRPHKSQGLTRRKKPPHILHTHARMARYGGLTAWRSHWHMRSVRSASREQLTDETSRRRLTAACLPARAASCKGVCCIPRASSSYVSASRIATYANASETEGQREAGSGQRCGGLRSTHTEPSLAVQCGAAPCRSSFWIVVVFPSAAAKCNGICHASPTVEPHGQLKEVVQHPLPRCALSAAERGEEITWPSLDVACTSALCRISQSRHCSEPTKGK